MQWPSTGVPGNPGAWLTAVARRRYVDGVRRQASFERTVAEISRQLAEAENPMDEIGSGDHVEDDVLRLIFTACPPLLSRDARVALTLKLAGGLPAGQIARAFLVPAPAMAARITRAKKALADAEVPFEVPFEVPSGAGLAARLASVLEVVYLIFSEGYATTSGGSWTRAELCEEAMRRGRMLAALAPGEPEVHGLVALMEIQASRIPARTGRDGELITLPGQDRSRWNRLLITHGLAALATAESLSGSECSGLYVIQAALAACHAQALVAADTDWIRIATLYSVLASLAPSPVIELNRAVAVSMADGPAAGLAIVDTLAGEPALRGYHLLPSVRGDLLDRLGRRDEAHAEFQHAAAMTASTTERARLLARAAACG